MESDVCQDRCLKPDASEKPENEVGGMRMRRLSFRGATM
jgi:hypothetical protein